MNRKELAFVAAVLADGPNYEQAAIKAGYARISARKWAYKIARREHVAAALARAGKRLEEQNVLDGKGVIDELTDIALSDLTEFMKRDAQGNYFFRAPHELTPKQRKVIKSIEVEHVYGPKQNGVRTIVGQRFRYEIHDKFQALMALGKSFGTFGDTKQAPNVTLNMFANMPQDQLEKLEGAMRAAIDGQFTKVEETSDGTLLSHA